MSFYKTRPLGPWLESVTPANDRRSRWTFKATWSDTERLLEDELCKLAAKQVVLQLDVREQDIRIDGQVRANARAIEFPGVRISFESKHGPLTYATDTHEFWQHNVRGIALGLQALRAVDRYGVTKRGEQYRGWNALPAGAGTSPNMTEQDAISVLRKHAGRAAPPIGDHEAHLLERWARIGAHPDRHNGDHTASDEVLAALAVLGITS